MYYCYLFLFPVLLLLLFPSANSVSFNTTQFNDTRFVYQGEATASDDGFVEFHTLRPGRAGWVTYGESVKLWDSSSGNLDNFTTHFSISIDSFQEPYYSHGLAFFLAPIDFKIPRYSAGGNLGLFNVSNASAFYQKQIVAVGFVSDAYNSLPPTEQIGIKNCSHISDEYTEWNASFHNGDIAELARLVDHGSADPRTAGLAGTFGYLAPEYITTGRTTTESDVYSFRVVALEIGSGRRACDLIDNKPGMGLVRWIWDLHGSCCNLQSLADKKLKMDFDAKEFERLMIVGLLCTHSDPSFRPSIKQEIQVMNFETPIPSIRDRIPVPTCHHVHVPVQPIIGSKEPSLLQALKLVVSFVLS